MWDRMRFEWTKERALKFHGVGLLKEQNRYDFDDEEEMEDEEDFEFETSEFIDLIHVEGVECKALMGVCGSFVGIKLVCFKDWFRCFPVSGNLRLDFDVSGRTFHLAVIGGMHWYIVMKPKAGRRGGKVMNGGKKGMCMGRNRSGKLCNFVLRVLMGPRLMHLGYNERNYNGRWNRD